MKKMILLSAVLVYQTSIITHAQSQVCAADVNLFEAQCSNQFCQDVYPLTTTDPCSFDQDCILWNSANYNCCGINGTYWATDAGICLFSLLKDKNVQSDLIALAGKEEILVPSCSGAYLPFELVRNRVLGA